MTLPPADSPAPTMNILAPPAILKTCIQCGCCNATCPTFDLLGDERDSPRGRIHFIKELVEEGRKPDAEMVTHLDRCLSCNACLTACPSGVDYMHLIDHARSVIETHYRRPLPDRMLRVLIARTLPHPGRFRAAMIAARPFRGLSRVLSSLPGGRRFGALLGSVPRRLPRRSEALDPGHFAPDAEPRGRVLIPSGCVQQVLAPDINRAAVSLLTAVGIDVTIPRTDACCGALVLHLGKASQAREQAKRNVDAWYPLVEQGLDAIVITTSGCGTTIKDYGHLLADDPAYAARAARIAALAKDVSEYLVTLDLPEPIEKPKLKVAYHSACSMQHGQKIMNEPRKLLLKAGFKLVRPKDEHLCCGSAGTYSILEPEISTQLRDRKAQALEETEPDVIAGGNLGCLAHIGEAVRRPVVHTVELLAWSYTGEVPAALK